MTGFGVHPGEMRAHADHVTGVGDRIGTAAGVAGQTTSHIEMFGLIGQFLVPIVQGVEVAAQAAIKVAESTTHGVSGAVTEMAKDYEANEQAIKKILDGIYGGD